MKTIRSVGHLALVAVLAFGFFVSYAVVALGQVFQNLPSGGVAVDGGVVYVAPQDAGVTEIRGHRACVASPKTETWCLSQPQPNLNYVITTPSGPQGNWIYGQQCKTVDAGTETTCTDVVTGCKVRGKWTVCDQ